MRASREAFLARVHQPLVLGEEHHLPDLHRLMDGDEHRLERGEPFRQAIRCASILRTLAGAIKRPDVQPAYVLQVERLFRAQAKVKAVEYRAALASNELPDYIRWT